MASLVFVSCELVIQVLQLISRSQNMTLALVKNAFYSRVLSLHAILWLLNVKKKIILSTEKAFYEFR